MFAQPFFSPAPPRRLVLHTASVVVLSAAATALGTWYFAATAYTTAGIQSALSAVVSKNIP
jgi:hypothetical protein